MGGKFRTLILWFLLLCISFMHLGVFSTLAAGKKSMRPLSAKAAVVMEMESGKILFARDAYRPLYPASMTKLLTAILLVEHTRPEERILISQHAARQPKVRLGLRPGDSLTAQEALNALLLRSANDVATAIAEHVAGSEEAFSQLMNKRCLEMGLWQARFVTPNGLHSIDHMVSAYDMARIMRFAFHYPEIRETLGAKSANCRNRTIYNTNRLLGYETPEGKILGGKTGFTLPAGYCLVEVMETKQHTHRISVVMGEPNKGRMYQDTLTLLSNPFSQ